MDEIFKRILGTLKGADFWIALLFLAKSATPSEIKPAPQILDTSSHRQNGAKLAVQ
jgi:hypothetical protein